MTDKLMANDICKDLVLGSEEYKRLVNGSFDEVEYEVPEIKEIEGVMWKGKADIINHEEKLVIDLKTTGDIDRFQWSAKKFNYDEETIEDILDPKRDEDKGDDLWRVFNVIQEKITQGEFSAALVGANVRKVRKIKSFEKELKVNKELFQLATALI